MTSTTTRSNGFKSYATPKTHWSKLLGAYSLTNALKAFTSFQPSVESNRSKLLIEREVSDQLEQERGFFATSVTGLIVPFELFGSRATQSVGLGIMGGNLVGTEHSPIAQFLRPVSIAAGLGATTLGSTEVSKGNPNVTLPAPTSGTTGNWVREDQIPSQSDARFQTVTLTPRTIIAIGAATNLFGKMSDHFETFFREDLQAACGSALDRAIFSGAGGSSAEPLGILNDSDFPIRSLATDGAALAYADLTALERLVSVQNAQASLGWALSPELRDRMRRTDRGTNTGRYLFDDDAKIIGYPAAVSTSIPANLAKGSGTNLSALVFGSWPDLVIHLWGLELMSNPYGPENFNNGGMSYRAILHCDFKFRRKNTFAIVKDAQT